MSRIKEHNREMMAQAEYRADEMRTWPSVLEEKMREFLNDMQIRYEFQKVFYIYADDGWIVRYYIADFFIPDKNLIIETDGKFHDDHRQADKMRTKAIQKQYPWVEIYRWRWNDFKEPSKIDELLFKVGC